MEQSDFTRSSSDRFKLAIGRNDVAALPPGPPLDSADSDFLSHENRIYRKMTDEFVPLYGPLITFWWNRMRGITGDHPIRPVIVINDLQLAKQIMALANDRVMTLADRVYSSNRRNFLHQHDGAAWRHFQKHLGAALRKSCAPSRLNRIADQCVADWLSEMEERDEEEEEDSFVCYEAIDEMFGMAQNALSRVLFDRAASDIDRFCNLCERIDELFYSGDLDEIVEDREDELTQEGGRESEGEEDDEATETANRLQTAMQELHTVLQTLLDEHRNSMNSHKLDTADWLIDTTSLDFIEEDDNHEATSTTSTTTTLLTSSLSSLSATSSGNQIRDTTRRLLLIDLIFATQDGWGASIGWMVALLAVHPEIQQSVYAEFLTHYLEGANRNDAQQAGKDDDDFVWKRCLYSRAVVMESLRVGASSAFSEAHLTRNPIQLDVPPHPPPSTLSSTSSPSSNTVVNHCVIPAGSIIYANLFAILHSAEHWPEPEVMRPERFLDDLSATATAASSASPSSLTSTSASCIIRPEAYVPFGVGRRVCLGSNLTERLLQLILIKLVAQFTWQRVGAPQQNATATRVPDSKDSDFIRQPREQSIRFSYRK